MDPAIVSAMAAVFGSLVGGSATVVTAWVTQRTLSKRELLGAEIRTRQTLYGEFIRECSKLVVDSSTHTLDKPETLLPVYEVLKTHQVKTRAFRRAQHNVWKPPVSKQHVYSRINSKRRAANIVFHQACPRCWTQSAGSEE